SRSFISSEMFLVDCIFILSIVTASHAITCGYQKGDPKSARTAQSGYGCRVDTANGLWGFCPTAVISAKDCGLAGSFEYIACGAEARTQRLFPAPNAAEATITPLNSVSVPSSSLTGLASQPTATVVETFSTPASSSSSVMTASIVSSPSGPISTSSRQESTNLGAIVGGAAGGLTVICLTILGIVLIRRKNGVKGQATSPTGYTHHGRNDFAEDATLHVNNSAGTQKNYHCDSSHGPVDMYSRQHVNMDPVELSGQAQCTDIPKETK
ncbi:hypothetical protein T440DRAFT_529240, partial [Plenodomus tracheiphilus IPT5]